MIIYDSNKNLNIIDAELIDRDFMIVALQKSLHRYKIEKDILNEWKRQLYAFELFCVIMGVRNF